jgi:hypothetical protein
MLPLYRRMGFKVLVGLWLATWIGMGFVHTASARPEIRLELLIEKRSYKMSEPIEMKFKLVNVGKKPIWINTRMKSGTPSADPRQREVWVEMEGPDGKSVASKIRDWPTGLPKSESFQLLQPGQSFVHEKAWDLRDIFEIDRPGTYRIRATYHNVFGKELGLDVFQGPIQADAKIEVTS